MVNVLNIFNVFDVVNTVNSGSVVNYLGGFAGFAGLREIYGKAGVLKHNTTGANVPHNKHSATIN